jgi:hypothetical protein
LSPEIDVFDGLFRTGDRQTDGAEAFDLTIRITDAPASPERSPRCEEYFAPPSSAYLKQKWTPKHQDDLRKSVFICLAETAGEQRRQIVRDLRIALAAAVDCANSNSRPAFGPAFALSGSTQLRDCGVKQQGIGLMRSTARILVALVFICAIGSPSLAGPATGEKARISAACKKEAKAKKLSGAERRAFVKACVAKPA